MQVNNLKPKSKKKKKKIVGRGGKKGTYCGRGNKGQKARSGAHIDPLFEGGKSTLIDHMKKKKGFKSRKPEKIIVKFSELVKKFKNGDKITIEALVEKKIINKKEVCSSIKILGPKTGKNEFSFEEKIFLSKALKK